MDKGLTVPKWVMIAWPKIPQTPQNLSTQFVCRSPKVQDFNEKRLNWVFSVVHTTKARQKPSCRNNKRGKMYNHAATK